MKVVGRLEFTINDVVSFDLPKGTQLLHVNQKPGQDHYQASLWYLYDQNELYFETKQIRFTGTGHLIEIPTDRLRYMNTFSTYNNELWWHIFEIL